MAVHGRVHRLCVAPCLLSTGTGHQLRLISNRDQDITPLLQCQASFQVGHMQRFGEKLRVLRMQQGMTQRDLARALGYVTSGYISEVETDKKKPSLDLVLKVAQLFQITTDQLTND